MKITFLIEWERRPQGDPLIQEIVLNQKHWQLRASSVRSFNRPLSSFFMPKKIQLCIIPQALAGLKTAGAKSWLMHQCFCPTFSTNVVIAVPTLKINSSFCFMDCPLLLLTPPSQLLNSAMLNDDYVIMMTKLWLWFIGGERSSVVMILIVMTVMWIRLKHSKLFFSPKIFFTKHWPYR